EDIIKIVQAARAKYPGKPLILLGESLGCTFCVKIAGEHNDLVDGLVLSAPAIKVNPKMYLSPSDISAGLASLVTRNHKVKLHSFLTKLVCPRKEVVDELLSDPMMVTELGLKDLLATDDFVDKTAKLGKLLAPHLPLLIIQGSIDGCVAPVHVTDFMMNVPSDDQTLCWRGKQGHLQLETSFVRATSIDALGDWIEDHSPSGKDRVAVLKKSLEDVGGRIVQ
ncbi:MAG TPA: alpha/beta fold hydrolase, partial [Candidatus Melainabacteria bacterium]|nr:alpha/beta fold hydrolase [Candidatus Melainabacteria bacterium]